MTTQPATQSAGHDLLPAESVLELIATGAPLADTLDALCRTIDEKSGLMSAVYLLNRERNHLSLAAGPHLPDAWRDALQTFAAQPSETSCGAAIHSRAAVIVSDMLSDPLFNGWRDAIRAAGLASVWSTPFFSQDGHALGTFAVYSFEPGEPRQAHLDLVARATHLASIAVERQATEEDLRESERLLRVVLDTLPVGVAVVNPAADVILSNPASRRIWGAMIVPGAERYARSKGWWHATGKRVTPAEWASARALARGDSIVNDLIDIEAFDGVQKIIQNSAVPIRDADGSITGAVVVNEDVSARISAEHELQDSLAQMRALTGRLMRTRDDERRRIAQLLHETTAQDLAALKMHLACLSRTATSLSDADRAALTESIELADRSMSGIRTLSYLLHPPFLDENGLLPAIRWYAKGFADRSGIAVSLELPEALERLPQEVETTLFRVVQEALINIHHHAASSSARIALRADRGRLALQIEDRGRGIPADLLARLRIGDTTAGIGLAGMRERLEQLDGTLEIDSTEHGSTISATVPLAAGPS